MPNSPLVNYTKISPNRTSPRTHAIDTITIHCVVGQATVEGLGNVFAPTARKASANYGIGHDGRIGMYVEEGDRSWCSSNSDNDDRAITIEVASDMTHPYAVKDAAYKALINLLVDICRRHPTIGTLKWKGDKSLIGQPDKQNMTVHRWFANKSCPGEYLYCRHAQIAAEVNARLAEGVIKPGVQKPKPAPAANIKVGDLVSITPNAVWYNGSDIPNWVCKKKWLVKSVAGDRVVLGKSEDGKHNVNSPICNKYLLVAIPKSELPCMVQVTIDDLNIRKGPGTNYPTNGVTGKGIFTITEIASGKGSKAGWGKLKSLAGWISLDYAKRI